MSTDLQILPTPTTMIEAIDWARFLADSKMVPKEFRDSPADILIAIQLGLDVGLSWAQSLQSIAVIGGKPAMYGDACLAVVNRSGEVEHFEELLGKDSATCIIHRKGRKTLERTFTMEMAKGAGLLTKGGPWQQYPMRMLQMRARSWALRDAFPDVLKGIQIREEVSDIDGEKPREVADPVVAALAREFENNKRSDRSQVDAQTVAALVSAFVDIMPPKVDTKTQVVTQRTDKDVIEVLTARVGHSLDTLSQEELKGLRELYSETKLGRNEFLQDFSKSSEEGKQRAGEG